MIIDIVIFILPILTLAGFFFFYFKPLFDRDLELSEQLVERNVRVKNSVISGDKALIEKVNGLEKEMDNLIADIRQETNNNIDKINLWLSLWMAVIAIFCGFIPIIIQYRLYIINRDKLEEEINYFRDFVRVHSIHNISGNFNLVSDLKIVTDSSVRYRLLRSFICESADIFREIVDSLSRNHKGMLSPDMMTLLIQALLQISSISEKIRKLVPREHKREYDMISDSIKNELTSLLNSDKPGWATTRDVREHNLHQLADKIDALSHCLP